MRKKHLLLALMALLCTTSLFAAKKVAFVYQSGYNVSKYVWDASGYQPSKDPIHIALAATYDVTDFVYAQTDVPDTTTLKTYDLVVLGEAVSGGQKLSNTMAKLVGKVPMLNMKAFVYTSGRWGWATPANPATKTTSVTINSGFENHAIFKGLTVTDGVVQIFDGTSTASNLIQGFGSVVSTSPIQTDHILANVTGTTSYAIHEITNLDKKYMLIPISSDVVTTVSENGVKLVVNACEYLMGGASGFDPDADFRIAYLYDSTYTGYVGIKEDPIFNYSILAEKNCEAINIKNFTATSTDTLAALQKYDLVVVSEAISSSHAFAKPLLTIVNKVPMLNFKSFFYKNTVWNWGAGKNPSTVSKNAEHGVSNIVVPKDFLGHELFANIEIPDSTISIFKTDTIYKNLMQAYVPAAGSYIENDTVLATVKGTDGVFNKAIHVHGTTNKYMLLPISSDAMMLNGAVNLSDNAFQLISNAVYYLLKSKSTVLPAVTPTVSMTYKNKLTEVSLSTTTADAKIYYTLDGTVPTTSSLVYSDTLSITDSCMIKAIAVKQGFDNSSVITATVLVKSMAATPSISVAVAETGKAVTITASEGATVYYTTNGGTPVVAKAVKYTVPFTLIRPCTVKAIAVQDGKLNSDIASEKITIDGYKERAKTLVWANFNDSPTVWIDTMTTQNVDLFGAKGYAYT
ncbi:MAG: FN3 associated domain-containing protein, partial [Bacteroidota bacterium]|nr:FN3 associated domain-containing protein [Bacteroidota bacterium]